jgi:hypothetical protein
MLFKEAADAAGIALISSWMGATPPLRFSGIAYVGDAIIIGQEGFDTYAARNQVRIEDFTEGRFSLFGKCGRDTVALTDYMGQDAAFYYHEGEQWAVSNSFLYLAEYLANQGVRLTPYQSALIPYLGPHGFTEQLISHNTPILEIKLLSATSMARIPAQTGRFTLEKRAASLEPGDIGASEYEALLVDYATKWSSRMAALVESFPSALQFDISGGRDSRAVLALCCAGVDNLSQVNFCSNKNRPEDFTIAEALASSLNFEIKNQPLQTEGASAEAAYQLWKYGNLGVYYPVYIARGTRPSQVIQFHGAGGECFRYPYSEPGEKFANLIEGRIMGPSSMKQAFKTEYYTGYQELGLPMGQKSSGATHYRALRSRLHFGRNWFRSLSSTLVTPLASWDLLKATSFYTDREKSGAKLFCDLMFLCAPSLAHAPFDVPSKAFQPDILEASPFAKSRPSMKALRKEITLYQPEKREFQPRRPRTDIDFKRLMLRGVRENTDRAEGLGILPKGYAETAISEINNGTAFTKDSRKAAHTIAIGEVARICLF